MLKGGYKKCWGSFYVVARSFHSLKCGTQKVLPCIEGGGRGTNSFGPAIYDTMQ